MTTKQEQAALTKYDLYFESRLTKTESAIESLKNDVKEIKTDLRWILSLIICFSGILMGLMAKGFHWF